MHPGMRNHESSPKQSLRPASSSQAPSGLRRVPAVALRPPWGHPHRLYLTSCEKRGRQCGGWPEVDSVSPFPQKQGMSLVFFYWLSSPTHLPMAIRHDLFMLPLLTASRYSESNFTGSKLSRQLSKQKTMPDCCPMSMPAHKSFPNKTAQNKQKRNSNVCTTLWGNYVSQALESSQGDLRLF